MLWPSVSRQARSEGAPDEDTPDEGEGGWDGEEPDFGPAQYDPRWMDIKVMGELEKGVHPQTVASMYGLDVRRMPPLARVAPFPF